MLGHLLPPSIGELTGHIFGQAIPGILLEEYGRASTMSKWQMNQNGNFEIWEGKEEERVYSKIYERIFIEELFGKVKDKKPKTRTPPPH